MIGPAYARAHPEHTLSVGLLSTAAGRDDDDRAKLNAYIKQAKEENRALFIYDEVGKQVRWLQYALEKENIKNYYFMATGAKGYYKQMMSEFGIQ